MLLHHSSKKRIQNIASIRALVKYTAIAFCVTSSNKVFSSSFSLDSNLNLNSNSARFHSTTSSSSARSPFLIHRGGSSLSSSRSTTTSILQMSTTSEATPTSTVPATAEAKLMALRAKMAEHKLDAYIVPSDDPHLSEYVPEAYMRRKFLTDFGGSAGTAVVFQDKALLWTDSRYYNEANLQLDGDHWELMKQGLPKVPTITKYISDMAVKHYTDNETTFKVGIDPFVHAASFATDLNDAFENAVQSSELKDDTTIGAIDTLSGSGSGVNLIDEVWGTDRPAIPTSPFRVHPLEYAGVSVQDKVEEIRDEMKEKKATLSVFSALDDIAYLFNVRAKGDVETCPVGIAYGTITHDEVAIYCNEAKVQSDEVQAHLKDAGVVIKPYDSIIDEIKSHLAEKDTHKIWLDATRSNYAISSIIPSESLVNKQNAVTPMKACKNRAEMEGMKRAHIVDGAAMANFIAWLEHKLVVEGEKVSEVEIDEVLTGYRAQQPGYIEDSFPTIAGVGSNGAIIHYRAKAGTDLLQYLDTSKSILIDSGGQYTYGTTDVTRTWHFGEGSSQFKENYTRVLKGNIGVDSMIFPEDTPGFVLDVFARKSLWEAELDYGHGTGHGVGAALNVHEGPHSISPRWGNKEVMKKGMVVSNEPGLYEDGSFGIRIENLLETTYLNEEDNVAYDEGLNEGDEGYPEKPAGKKTFLKFNKLTMIPIQKNLIDVGLMTVDELDWLDAYHEEVYSKVSPLLEKGSPGLEWLKKSCEKIDRTVA